VAGGSGDRPTSVWWLEPDAGRSLDLRPDVVVPDPAAVSTPRPVTFPTAAGESAPGLFHEPRSAVAVGPDDELPPLVVRIHGGPTAAARAEYSTSVQFWTSRGIAVVDVNYRGSTGYGRRYRDLLVGSWGVADVEDCIAAARWAADEGLVDGSRCVIRGGSAGGFTALAALCHHDDRPDAFAAACSLYGVTDLRTLAEDTHKFESRYLDGLVGPLPEAAERYRDRSPLHHADRLLSPVLLLQGADDPVVPPSQAEVLRDALAAGGVPHALVIFQGEAHGFRRAATIVAALEAELSFYGQVLGFTPADDLTPVELTT
jgi:dipeptidyl aminopeptidase/acylaminoacyl peptidase